MNSFAITLQGNRINNSELNLPIIIQHGSYERQFEERPVNKKSNILYFFMKNILQG